MSTHPGKLIVATLARIAALAALALGTLAGCASDASSEDADGLDDSEGAVVVNTSSPRARAQYDANVAFATSYKARCTFPETTSGSDAIQRPRVLVTGFGRFLDNTNNATGRIVSALVPGAEYPDTTPPEPGAQDGSGWSVDLPEPQTRVTVGRIELPRMGAVDVCVMVVPVYWDLASILVAKEIDAFKPALVLMNGIAGSRQDLWIELGSVNRAMPLEDGSDALKPLPPTGKSVAPIVPSASRSDESKGLLLSWDAVREAAAAEIEAQKDVDDDGAAFGDLLTGAKLAGFPRSSNTYLCNNITYVVNYLMSYPGRSITLLKASTRVTGKTNQVRAKISADVRTTPRVFLHWPSELADHPAHVKAAAGVLATVIDTQLASATPTVGDNALADVTLSGDTF
jgi:pyrrolidone-carboxylate peptidase